MTRPLLCLTAIFKDEAKTVRATLDSVKPFVDQWVVLDTGSIDGTQAIVREALSPLPGEIKEEPFVDYAVSRNRALEVAESLVSPSIFTLSLSADETLRGGEALRAFLEAHRDADEGAYAVEMRSGPRAWPYSRVLRVDAKWRYQGEVHERPVGPRGEVHASVIPGVMIVHEPSDPERKVKRLREYDRPRLQRVVEDRSLSLTERAHALFFLAETEAALGSEFATVDDESAITHWLASMSYYWRYMQIAQQSGAAEDREKAMYAFFLHLHVADKSGVYGPAEIIPRLELLVEAAPALTEARLVLAQKSATLDARKGLHLALESAKVAREQAGKFRSTTAVDTRVEWSSYRLASACADLLAKNPKANKTDRERYERQARECAEKAIAAGAPREEMTGLA
jgi:hypothetical protein